LISKKEKNKYLRRTARPRFYSADHYGLFVSVRCLTQDPRFADMLGFTEADVRRALTMVFDTPQDVGKALSVAKAWFNGYRFPYTREDTAGEPLYTPQVCLNFFSKCCRSPGFRHTVLNGQRTTADMSDPGVKVPSNIVPLLARCPELPVIFHVVTATDADTVCRTTPLTETFF